MTEETGIQLREMVDQVRNPPFAFQCGWQSGLVTAENSIITFERLSFSSMFGVAGGLEDIGGITLCFELAQFDWTP